MNPQETAQLVLDQIRMHPETHYQGSYESSCGTTRCVAGWAAHFHGYRQISAFPTAMWIGPGTASQPGRHLVHEVAAAHLGIGEDDANILFAGTLPSQEAVHALEYLAKGEDIDWHAVSGERYARLGVDAR